MSRERMIMMQIVVATVAIAGLARSSRADVLSFTDSDGWVEAVRGFATVDFVGFPDGAEVTDEYADLGVLFTPGANFALESPDWPDGGGLLGNGFGDISFEFIEPQLWIAVDYPGEVGFTLLLDGELVFETATTFNAPPAQFAFAGLVSTEPFNEVLIWDPGDQVAIDNLYFGVPGPSALFSAILLLGAAGPRRRRGGFDSGRDSDLFTDRRRKEDD